MLGACWIVHGSRLIAHGSRPRVPGRQSGGRARGRARPGTSFTHQSSLVFNEMAFVSVSASGVFFLSDTNIC